MSNYTKTTNFTAKDSLISGNPAKIVKGSEIDSEYTAIETAVNSKSNTASPTFTGTATIPTAAITNLTLGGTSVTSTAAELNALDGITATVTELNYTDGVTSAIQTQINAKAPLNSPVLITPNLGTPSAVTLTNGTGLPIVAGTTGTLSTARGGTGVTTASNGQLLIGNGSGFTAATLTAGTGVTLTNGAGSIQVAFSGPGAGDALTTNPLSQFAATTSAQLAGVLSDETGSGSAVFATSPTLVTPILGTPASATLTNATGLPAAGVINTAATLTDTQTLTNKTLTSPVMTAPALGTVASGNISACTSTSMTLVTPILGTPTSGNLSNTTADGTNSVGFKNLPAVGTKTASYTLAVGDIGKYVQLGASGAIVIPDATFSEGNAITLFNNTASTATITCSITTAYIAGTFTDKATMTLAAAGVATILFISGTTCVVAGNVT